MTTISIPVTNELDEFIEEQVALGNAASKADLIRRAIMQYKEEQMMRDILQAKREVREGKVFKYEGKKQYEKLLKKLYD